MRSPLHQTLLLPCCSFCWLQSFKSLKFRSLTSEGGKIQKTIDTLSPKKRKERKKRKTFSSSLPFQNPDYSCLQLDYSCLQRLFCCYITTAYILFSLDPILLLAASCRVGSFCLPLIEWSPSQESLLSLSESLRLKKPEAQKSAKGPGAWDAGFKAKVRAF